MVVNPSWAYFRSKTVGRCSLWDENRAIKTERQHQHALIDQRGVVRQDDEFRSGDLGDHHGIGDEADVRRHRIRVSSEHTFDQLIKSRMGLPGDAERQSGGVREREDLQRSGGNLHQSVRRDCE